MRAGAENRPSPFSRGSRRRGDLRAASIEQPKQPCLHNRTSQHGGRELKRIAAELQARGKQAHGTQGLADCAVAGMCTCCVWEPLACIS